MKVTSLDPIFDSKSRILILGTGPGPKSECFQFYYSDKRNQFWRLLEIVFDEEISDSKQAKVAFLRKHRIALWDVCKNCERTNAEDRTIKKEERNELEIILPPYSQIDTILCNGSKAFKLFKKHNKDIDITPIKLFSSSGAANRFSEQRKAQWVQYIRKQSQSL